jgi:hypothetical protein
MQEIVAQMLNYFWGEFIIINFLPCGRRELSTNLYFSDYPRIFTNQANLHESGEFARIVVYCLSRYLIELGVCLAADRFVIHELLLLIYPRSCTNQANLKEL